MKIASKIYFLLFIAIIFLFFFCKIVFFTDLPYKIIERQNSSVVEIIPTGLNEILVFNNDARIEYFNLISNESQLMTSGFPEDPLIDIDLRKVTSYSYISDSYIICGTYEVIIADRRSNPLFIKRISTDKIDKIVYLKLFYLPSNKIALIFDQDESRNHIDRVFYVNLKGVIDKNDNTELCFIPFLEDGADKNKLSREDYDDILRIKDKINKNGSGMEYFFPNENVIVSKKERIEIYDFKKKTTIFLPDFITFGGKKIHVKELILKSSLYSILRSKNKNTLITPMNHIAENGDFITIWDTQKRKELITFDVASGNYLNKGTFSNIVVSESGKFAAVLFKKQHKSFFSDYFDSKEYYCDVWNLEQQKILNTFFVPFSEKSGSYLGITWGLTDDRILIWFTMKNNNSKILIYNFNNNIVDPEKAVHY